MVSNTFSLSSGIGEHIQNTLDHIIAKRFQVSRICFYIEVRPFIEEGDSLTSSNFSWKEIDATFSDGFNSIVEAHKILKIALSCFKPLENCGAWRQLRVCELRVQSVLQVSTEVQLKQQHEFFYTIDEILSESHLKQCFFSAQGAPIRCRQNWIFKPIIPCSLVVKLSSYSREEIFERAMRIIDSIYQNFLLFPLDNRAKNEVLQQTLTQIYSVQKRLQDLPFLFALPCREQERHFNFHPK